MLLREAVQFIFARRGCRLFIFPRHAAMPACAKHAATR